MGAAPAAPADGLAADLAVVARLEPSKLVPAAAAAAPPAEVRGRTTSGYSQMFFRYDSCCLASVSHSA